MTRRKTGETEHANDILVNLNARIPKSLWRRVRLQCTRQGRLLRSFIQEALQERLHSQKRRHA